MVIAAARLVTTSGRGLASGVHAEPARPAPSADDFSEPTRCFGGEPQPLQLDTKHRGSAPPPQRPSCSTTPTLIRFPIVASPPLDSGLDRVLLCLVSLVFPLFVFFVSSSSLKLVSAPPCCFSSLYRLAACLPFSVTAADPVLSPMVGGRGRRRSVLADRFGTRRIGRRAVYGLV